MNSSLKIAKRLTELHDLKFSGAGATFSPNEERELFRLAEQNSALIFTVKQLERFSQSSELLRAKKLQIQNSLEREARRYQKVIELLKAFQKKEIETIALKGTALGAFIYHDPFYKRMNDFDLMIKEADLERVKLLLHELNYAPVGDLLEKEKKVASTHHLSPWVSRDLHCVLGIHWNLISPKRSEKIPALDLWEEALPIEEIEPSVKRLSNAHFLMHLMLHLPAFKTGIRELADLMNLAEFSSELEIDRLLRLTRDWNASDSVYRALAWVKALKPESKLLRIWPDIEKWVPESLRREMALFIKNEQSVLYFRTLQLSRVEKAFAQSWLSPSPKKRIEGWLKSWKETLFPTLREGMAVLRMMGEASRVTIFKVRIFAPFAIWSALCKEHGTIQIYAITFLNFGNMIVSGFKWILNPSSVKRVHPAEKILEELE